MVPGSVGIAMTLTEQDGPGGPHAAPRPTPASPGAPAASCSSSSALALLTAVFVLLGWGDLLLFIAILVAIVMLHELGHFATAKWAGMKVTEYFVGFGPRLWSVRRGETEYGVKAIPAGGYVRITGFTSTEEVAEEDEPRAYRNQPFHQRIIVASAGSAMHFLIAFVLALVLVVGFGTASNNYTVSSLEHWSGVATTPAMAAGLRPGDTIVSVDGRSFSNPNSMTDAIRDSVGRPLVLGVERDGRLLRLTATPDSGKGITADGQALVEQGLPGHRDSAGDPLGRAAPGPSPPLGHHLARRRPEPERPRADVLAARCRLACSTRTRTPRPRPPRPTTRARPRGRSPSSASPASGWKRSTRDSPSVLVLLIAINIVFGILNMLPMIPLDGGHVAIAAYEWIRTKKGQVYYRADITKLFPVAFMFLAFLALFVLSGVFLDITHPIQYPH